MILDDTDKAKEAFRQLQGLADPELVVVLTKIVEARPYLCAIWFRFDQEGGEFVLPKDPEKQKEHDQMFEKFLGTKENL